MSRNRAKTSSLSVSGGCSTKAASGWTAFKAVARSTGPHALDAEPAARSWRCAGRARFSPAVQSPRGQLDIQRLFANPSRASVDNSNCHSSGGRSLIQLPNVNRGIGRGGTKPSTTAFYPENAPNWKPRTSSSSGEVMAKSADSAPI
jgi:hypothetical protein